MIRCVRIWTGDDGNSCFEEGAIDLGDKLALRLGPENVTRLLPRDSHLPERVQTAAPLAALRPRFLLLP